MPSCEYELPFYIDATMRSAWRACPRKYFWAYVMRRVTPSASIHLHAGKAFAKGCEEVRRKYYGEGWPLARAIEWGQLCLFRSWAETHEEVDVRDTGKSLPNMLFLLEDYFQEFEGKGSDLRPVLKDNGEPAVEFSFSIPIPGTCHPTTGEEVLYVGRLDMLGERADSPGHVWAVDEKTTSALGPKWGQQWELRGQFIGYTWAARMHGHQAVGAIARGCKVTPTGAIGFAEVPIEIRPHVVDRWLEELTQDVNDICEAWKKNHWRFDFADACSAYGGCAYQIGCGAKRPEKWIEANFVPNEWNPVTGEGTLDHLIPTTPQE